MGMYHIHPHFLFVIIVLFKISRNLILKLNLNQIKQYE